MLTSKSVYLLRPQYLLSKWKTIACFICLTQLFIILLCIFLSTSCNNNNNNRILMTSINKNNINKYLNKLSYPIPMNIKDFKYEIFDNTSLPSELLKPTKLSNLIKISNKLLSIYPDKSNKNLIFIALASYPDNECVQTIINAFETAMYPERICFGVFQQHNISDGDCTDFDKYLNCDINYGVIHPLCGRFWQIKIARIEYSKAKGPMYGRYRAELFYENEDYLLQIDAHTRFTPHWDNILIDMFERINNPKAMLTTYPKATDENTPGWKPINVRC